MGHDSGADRFGAFPPELGAVGEAEAVSDAREPVAGGPAHDARLRMHFGARAKLPQSCVWLRPAPRRFVAQLLKLVKQAGVREARETFIEKALRHRQNHAAIAIVLDLVIGAIADAHRPHAAIAGQAVDDPLGQRRLQANAV